MSCAYVHVLVVLLAEDERTHLHNGKKGRRRVRTWSVCSRIGGVGARRLRARSWLCVWRWENMLEDWDRWGRVTFTQKANHSLENWCLVLAGVSSNCTRGLGSGIGMRFFWCGVRLGRCRLIVMDTRCRVWGEKCASGVGSGWYRVVQWFRVRLVHAMHECTHGPRMRLS